MSSVCETIMSEEKKCMHIQKNFNNKAYDTKTNETDKIYVISLNLLFFLVIFPRNYINVKNVNLNCFVPCVRKNYSKALVYLGF